MQGLTVHIFWAERSGLHLSDERKQEVELRTIPRRLARTLELDDRPLTQARPLDKRLVGNCRDFSTLLCAILRHQGVPARARRSTSPSIRSTCRAISSSPEAARGRCAARVRPILTNLASCTCTGCGSSAVTWGEIF